MSKVQISLGNDAIIYGFPIGQAMRSLTGKDFWISLVSSFRFEDHLSPVTYFIGYLCSYISTNSELVLNCVSKFAHIILCIGMVWLAQELWKNRYKTLATFLFLTLSVHLTGRNMVTFQNAGWAPIIGIYTLIFLNRVLKVGKKSDFFFLSFLYFIMTLSFESGFVAIIHFGVYTTISLLCDKALENKVKTKRFILIALTLSILFLPYLLIHQSIYESPIPGNRNSSVLSLNEIPNSILRLMNSLILGGWRIENQNLGVFLFLFPVIAALLRCLSITGKALSIGFFAQSIAIIFIGRNEPGMWLFTGLIFILIEADILIETALLIQKFRWLKRIQKTFYYLIIPVCMFFIVYVIRAESIHSFFSWKTLYGTQASETRAFSKAIGEPGHYLTLVSFEGLPPLPGTESLWLANQSQFHQQSLWLYPKAFMFHEKDALLEIIRNLKINSFPRMRNSLTREHARKDLVLFKGKNLYTRTFLDSSNPLLARAAIIPELVEEHDSFAIPLPYLSSSNSNQINLEIKLYFSEKSTSLGMKILTSLPFLVIPPEIILSYGNPHNLTSIEVSEIMTQKTKEKHNIDRNIPTTEFILKTESMPCTYEITSSQPDFFYQIDAIQSAHQSFTFRPIFQLQLTQVWINHRLIQRRGKKAIEWKQTLFLNSSQTQKPIPITLCPSSQTR